MGERFRALWLAVVACSVLGAETSSACSCGGFDDRFLVETGVLLPANARGVPWWGTVDPRRGDPEGMPAKTRFSVERVDGQTTWPIDFDVIRLPTAEVHGIPDRFDETVWVIAPDHGFSPGARYRFRSTTLPWFIPGEMEPGPSDDYRRELVVEVSIARDPLDVVMSAPVLRADRARILRLDVTTLAGSCGTTVDAAASDLELELPPDTTRFAGSLLFSTIVDGRPWRPTKSLCERLAPGESWVGHARERVFLPCPRDPGDRHAEPAFGTGPGAHTVEMIAWLPGTPIAFRATNTVELGCPATYP